MRLLLISEEPVLARGLESVVSGEAGHHLIHCSAKSDIVAVIGREQPHVVLIDFIPEKHFGTVFHLLDRLPHCRIVLWVRDICPELAYQVLKLGVRAILRSTAHPDEVRTCLSEVEAGEFWLEDDLKFSVFHAKTSVLSPRESQLIILISQGLKNKDIAAALSLSEATVRIYLSTIFRKTGTKDRYELALYGFRTLLR